MAFNKFLFKILVAVMSLFVLISSFTLSASAISGIEEPAYTNYFYEHDGKTKRIVEDRPVYVNTGVIDGNSLGIDSFYIVNDVFSTDDAVYILDSGNGRIVILNKDYTLKKIIDSFVMNGEKQELNEPQGIYIDGENIYIADTENMRVLQCDINGNISVCYTAPESELIPDGFDFYPINMLIDKSGYLYILTRGSYYGAMMYDLDRNFVGFYGANSVSVDILEGMASFFNSIFETNEKLQNKVKKLPYQFYDFDTDNSGFIYTVSPSEAGQIKKLNLKGINTLKYKSGVSVVSAEGFNFGALENYTELNGKQRKQAFSSIAVDEKGFMYALDSAYGKVYIYDSKCNNIAVFGGGVGVGYQKGTFVSASKIEINGEDLLICDTEKNSITVMNRTDYGNLIMQAGYLTDKGEFEEAETLWKEVLTYNSNRQVAYRGLALVNLNSENYNAALEYSKFGLDQESYAAAYEQLISIFLNKHLWWILLIVLALIIALTVMLLKPRKEERKSTRFRALTDVFGIITHPIDLAAEIRAKRAGSVWAATVVLIVFYFSQIAVKQWAGFMYVLPSSSFNPLYALLGSVGVIVLWIICHWGVSAIFSGKATLRSIYIVSSYSMLPLIFYNILFTLMSYFVVPSSSSFITVLQMVAYAAVAILLIFTLINLQEYSLGKLLGVSFVTVFGMLVTAFLIFMVLTLGQNFISFAVNIVSEGIYR